MEYEKLNKNAKKVMYIATFLWSAVLSALIIVGYYFIDKSTLVTVVFVVLQSLIALNLIISPHIRYLRYRYLISEDKIDIIEGFIWISRDIVPINRIHKITLSRGPIDNMFKLTKVHVTTAGGEATIRFLDIEKAEFIADSLKDKINESVKED